MSAWTGLEIDDLVDRPSHYYPGPQPEPTYIPPAWPPAPRGRWVWVPDGYPQPGYWPPPVWPGYAPGEVVCLTLDSTGTGSITLQ